MDPLAAGLHAGDPEQLSVSAVFPRLKQAERRSGSLALAALRSRFRKERERAGRDAGPRKLFSLRRGLGALPEAIAHRLAGRVFLGERAEAVQRGPAGMFRVLLSGRCGARAVTARSVVVALPAYAAGALLDRFDPDVAETLARISHPPLAVVFLGYRSGAVAHPLDGAGVLAPAVENRDILGLLFSSTLFPGRAPPGHVALTAFVGGARAPRLALLPPQDLRELAHREARELLGVGAAPVLARTRCWRHGLPQPGLDHAQRLDGIAAFESAHEGLFLTGNYFSGVGTAACIRQALATAQRVARHLAARPGSARRVA